MARGLFGGLFPDYADGVAAGDGGGGDTTAPTITIVSPTPGVAPGAPGGFPANYAAAKVTPVVLTVSDDQALGVIVLTCKIDGVWHVVYDGTWIAPFYGSADVDGLEVTFTIYRTGGWPAGGFTFRVRAGDGNDAG